MLQLPLFEPPSSWKPPIVSELPSWAGMKRVCVDVETRDDKLKELGIGVRRGGYITGISVTIEDSNQSFYLPIRHAGGDNMNEQEVLRYLRDNGRQFTGQIVGANLGYDLDYLWQEDILFPQVSFFRDVLIADPLIFELHNSYSLLNVGKRHDVVAKNEAALEEAAKLYGVDPKSGMWKLPARHVAEYAIRDTQSPLEILRKQEAIIEKEDLWNIWNLESKVLPVLVKMRRRGVRIDENKLAQVCKWAADQEREALAIVKNHTGVDIGFGNVWQPDALAPALKAAGIAITLTATGKASIKKDVLAGIDHPVAKAIAYSRKVNKLRTTFGASVYQFMVNGRIHAAMNQIAVEDEESGDMKGARYGRLSSEKPNIQQQPARDEFAAFWRSIYLPEEGAIWATKDYSQQEPRWTTHFAAQLGLPQAGAAAKRYRDDPTTDNHQMMAEITGLPRKAAKNIFLGLCYGEGGAKLCRELGLSTRWALGTGSGRDYKVEYFPDREAAMNRRFHLEQECRIWEAAGEEGQKVLDTFDSRCPYVRKLAKEATRLAKKRGWVRTIGGRRLNFPEKEDGSRDWTHKALNRVIQGSSADQVKAAIVEIDRSIPEAFLQLQVHDELDGSYGSVAEAQRVADIMRNIITSEHVPFKVDLEIGPSWGEAKAV